MELSEIAAALACRALLYEVCTTPKPGLVDRCGSGSHKDMDIFTFMDSTSVLFPYFKKCASIGADTAYKAPAETFRCIRPAGIDAERDMLAATNGVNTHKGAIFSMGIVCAALGRVGYAKWGSSDTVLDECAAMTKGLAASDFRGLTESSARTAGQRLYLKYGMTGVRGQMEAGLPAVRNIGLPALKKGISRGLSVNGAGCAALLAILTASDDTNMIARSSVKTQRRVASEIRELLKRDPYPDVKTLEELDRRFVKENLSPGGSADLLAICYLLYFIESGEHLKHLTDK